ncbi:ubiquitin-related domain-containing protein [Fennellomyces sp. T-0311]|nr:ubiquitin-related domain-containing protein [Fennellomyces sp. T-0311]
MNAFGTGGWVGTVGTVTPIAPKWHTRMFNPLLGIKSIGLCNRNMSGDETSNNGQPTAVAKQAESSEIPSTVMALRIKSLEQQTKPVTISRDASVLDLKQAVQSAFQVESQRQRLIFQGKVLKDEKNLTDYANLDNGKVVHLVVRPADVPQNPQNDDPRPQSSSNRRSFAQRIPFSRLFPITGRPPAMEGYTFITLDVGDPGHHLSSLMDGLGNLFPTTNLATPPRSRTSPGNTNASNGRPSLNSSCARTRIDCDIQHQQHLT